ncbi:MAG TPA: AmmeMemoRadiSam system protein A [Thermoanaerobaculia bacterium]|nr:AmmeMemoRadiSam system protein A [Thermoanaerobaculia bacterium]
MNVLERQGPWDEARGRVLLRIARESLAEALGVGQAADYREPWLQEPGACFVTLTLWENLRGCVGSVRAYRALFDDVWLNARAAAFHDNRFPPVERDEFSALSVEVSLLSAPEPLPPFARERDALAALRPGIDGIVLDAGAYRSTFLPQVWEQLPDPAEFLEHLKRKAGLPPGYWSPEVQLQRYTVRKWVEGE